jgi:hypothetical protein
VSAGVDGRDNPVNGVVKSISSSILTGKKDAVMENIYGSCSLELIF